MKTLHAAALVFVLATLPLAAQTKAAYQAAVSGQSPTHYFKLDGTLSSASSGAVLSTAVGHAGGYTSDVYQNLTNAYFFANQTDSLDSLSDPLVNGGGLANSNATAKGSITMLFRTLSGINSGQAYLFSAGQTTSNHNALALFIENDDQTNDVSLNNCLRLRFGDDTFTLLAASNMPYSTWHYFALTYDLSRETNKATWYVGQAGGTLTSGMTTNSEDAVAGEGSTFAIGNRNDTFGSGFRNPGNGRIDEFAVWHSELTAAQITNQFTKLPLPPSGVVVTNVIVNDSFADGNRTNTGPLQADWWSSNSTNANSVEVYPNQLGLISGTTGRGIHGTFAPQILGVGDTIRATYTFTTPATVGNNVGTAFKVAMMDFNDAGLAADLAASSTSTNLLYTNLPGYMSDFDVNTGAAADTAIREHITPNTTGRFLNTTTEWTSPGNSPDAGYAFAPNTEYVGVFAITRTDGDSVDIFSSISQGTNLMDSFTAGDASGIANHFGMLAFWANSSAFGSTTNVGEFADNGITFSNIKVEVVTLSTEAPTLSILRSGGNAILSWLSTFAGYALESTTSLSSPSWTGAGSPTLVGDRNYVTNALSGTASYYRLKK